MTVPPFDEKHKGEIGREGEALARKFLSDKGLKIIGHNYRTRWGELDIVARAGDTLVFVEVKTRSGRLFGGPLAAVTLKKQQRIRRMAKTYLAEKGLQDIPARFDVVGIVMRRGDAPHIQWIENAFGGL